MIGPELSQWLATAQAAASLITALAWLIIAVVMLRLLPQIRSLSQNVEEFSVRGPLNTNFTLRTSRAERNLSDAYEQRFGKAAPASIAKEVQGLARPGVLRRLQGARALWVDDDPDNSRYERRALEALGIEFSLAPDTQQALDKLRGGAFDLVISDMSRPESSRAGYDLLDAVRRLNPTLPFLVYSSSDKPEDVAEAKRRGARGATNNPVELLRMVVETVAAP